MLIRAGFPISAEQMSRLQQGHRGSIALAVSPETTVDLFDVYFPEKVRHSLDAASGLQFQEAAAICCYLLGHPLTAVMRAYDRAARFGGRIFEFRDKPAMTGYDQTMKDESTGEDLVVRSVRRPNLYDFTHANYSTSLSCCLIARNQQVREALLRYDKHAYTSPDVSYDNHFYAQVEAFNALVANRDSEAVAPAERTKSGSLWASATLAGIARRDPALAKRGFVAAIEHHWPRFKHHASRIVPCDKEAFLVRSDLLAYLILAQERGMEFRDLDAPFVPLCLVYDDVPPPPMVEVKEKPPKPRRKLPG